ncbi:sialic acid-binding Ig-like lectin 14 [Leptodactylus fuscus]|uniref:sialic acid-binding Ig-like lectin 14 n=1 Tax=Leptodactylus fuscus TaxID=238119 RepID=UPI003F4E6A08
MWQRKCFFLDYYLSFILIQSQLWSDNVCERLPGYTINTSPHVTVQRGLCVHVPCSFTVPSDVRLSKDTTGIWYQDIGGRGVLVALKNRLQHYTNGRFSFTGDVSRGDCSYYIEDPWPLNSTYFRIEDGSTKYTYEDIQPYVTVSELTDKPTISSPRLVEGKEVTLNCTSPSTCPHIRPRFSWEGEITGRRKEIKVDINQTFQSTITFTPRKSDHRSSIYCRVILKQDLATVEEKTLNVEYSPFMNIAIGGIDTNTTSNTNDTTTVTVKDGDSITLKCIVDSNPNAAITWYKDNKMVQRTTSNQTVTLTLINMNHNDAGRYQCSAENEHGGTHRMVVVNLNGESIGNHYMEIILLTTLGPICLLLLVLLVYAYWRKRQKKRPSTETEDTYTDLRMSHITSAYDQLKPEIPADIAVVGSEENPSHVYENVRKKNH